MKLAFDYRFILILACCVFSLKAGFTQQSAEERIIDSLTKKLNETNIDTGRADLLFHIGIQYYYLGNPKAEDFVRQSLELSKKQNWYRGIGNAYGMYANIFIKKGDFPRTIQFADSAYDAFSRENRKRGMASAIQKKGAAYNDIGLYTEALKYHLETARINEELKDTGRLVLSYINIGNSYSGNHDNTKALEIYEKGYQIGKTAGLKREIIPLLLNIGQIYATSGKYEKAEEYYNRTENALRKTPDATIMGQFYISRADLFQKTKDYGKAFEFYKLALEKELELGNQYQIGRSHFGIGLIYLDVAKSNIKNGLPAHLLTDKNTLLKHAKTELINSVEVGKKVNDLNGVSDEYYSLSDIEERLGNHTAALEYYKDHVRYKDSIFNDENKKKLTAFEIKHLEDVKNREIDLVNKDKALAVAELQKKNLLITFIVAGIVVVALFVSLLVWSYNKRKRTRFSQQVTEMENQLLRLQMNPHFIFNALHAINKYMLDNEREKASDYLSRFSQLMRLTLDNSRKREVLLSEDLQALELYMQLESLRFPKGFQYTIEVANEIDRENTLVPPMLLQPFVENAILHGISRDDNGMINVRVFPEGTSIKCIVEDNGKGFPTEIANDPSQKNNHISMGVRITRERLRIIERIKKQPTSLEMINKHNRANDAQTGVKVILGLPYETAF